VNQLMRYAPILLIAAGFLASSSFIIAKKPNAKQLVDKIAPYQAGMGIALLFWGLYNALIYVGIGNMLRWFGINILAGITVWGALSSAVVLGFLFGLPQIAKWSAAGASRGEVLAKKLAPFQTMIGFVAIGSGVLLLMFNLGILTV